jgi:hypothetical protein
MHPLSPQTTLCWPVGIVPAIRWDWFYDLRLDLKQFFQRLGLVAYIGDERGILNSLAFEPSPRLRRRRGSEDQHFLTTGQTNGSHNL